MNKVSLVKVLPVVTLHASIRDDPYWNSRKNSLEVIELSSIIKLVWFRFPPVVTLDQ